MKTTKYTIGRFALIILYERYCTHLLVKETLAELFEKVSSCIGKDARLYDNYAFNGGFDYIHTYLFNSSITFSRY